MSPYYLMDMGNCWMVYDVRGYLYWICGRNKPKPKWYPVGWDK